MEWNAGSDGAGPVTFFAGWNTDAEPNIAGLTGYGAGAGSHDLTPTDGSILYAHLVQQDANGNRQVQTFGPIIYDPPLTPLSFRKPVLTNQSAPSTASGVMVRAAWSVKTVRCHDVPVSWQPSTIYNGSTQPGATGQSVSHGTARSGITATIYTSTSTPQLVVPLHRIARG